MMKRLGGQLKLLRFGSISQATMDKKPVHVVVTGAAGRIAYSLIPLILSGLVFGKERAINLSLLDIPLAEEKLKGVVMEIEDSGYALLHNLVATTNPDEAFAGAEVVVLLGGFPRLAGMERKDLLIKNAESIQAQARSLNKYGSSNTKVVVVANPANTNCLVAIKSAPSIPAGNFTCLTRLDQERLRSLSAQVVSRSTSAVVRARDVSQVFIWGNHSTTQVAHIDEAAYATTDGVSGRLSDVISGQAYTDLLKRVQNRGAEIIKATQLSSGLSAAEAIAKHLADWLSNAPSEPFSMGILSTGNAYGVAEDLVFSFPCERADTPCGYRVVPDLTISADMRSLLDISTGELLDEQDKVKDYLV